MVSPEIDIEQVVQESVRIFCTTPKSATFRQHAQKVSSQVEQPRLSYYSEDYNHMPKTDLVRKYIDAITYQDSG